MLRCLNDTPAGAGRQDQGEENSGKESADMSPPGHPAARGGLDGLHLESREELDQEPVPEEKQGGEFDGPEEEKEGNEGGNARGRERNKVGAQDAGDRAAGANGGHTRSRVEQDMEKTPGQAGKKVYDQEFRMPETVFDAAAENKQEEHVSQQMEPAAMQEQGGKKGNQGACQGCVVEVVGRGIPSGDHTESHNHPIEGWSLGQFQQEDPHIGDNQQQGDEPKGLPPDMVMQGNRNHAAKILPCEGADDPGKYGSAKKPPVAEATGGYVTHPQTYDLAVIE